MAVCILTNRTSNRVAFPKRSRPLIQEVSEGYDEVGVDGDIPYFNRKKRIECYKEYSNVRSQNKEIILENI